MRRARRARLELRLLRAMRVGTMQLTRSLQLPLLSDSPTVRPSVLDHRQRGTDLIGTLQAYFAAGQSPTRAATSLHIHPNTVQQRLDRVTALLGDGWQSPDHTLDIQVALRLHTALG